MGLVKLVTTVLVSSGHVTLMAYFLSLPVSLFVASILTAANTRDIEKDKEAGRKTLAVILRSALARSFLA